MYSNNNSKEVVTLQIWDTAGDHKLRDLVSLYYRNSHSALLVFDITQNETKENLQDWLVELEDRCDLSEVIIKVAANKFDIFEGKSGTWTGSRKPQITTSQFEEVITQRGHASKQAQNDQIGSPGETGGHDQRRLRGLQHVCQNGPQHFALISKNRRRLLRPRKGVFGLVCA